MPFGGLPRLGQNIDRQNIDTVKEVMHHLYRAGPLWMPFSRAQN